jgi:L-cystine uptake protein TcyP (sodium:dicarboxylate symporter family)
MGSELVIVLVLFGTIFGIVYLFISSRHKERMSLIEKGIDASIFILPKQQDLNTFR